MLISVLVKNMHVQVQTWRVHRTEVRKHKEEVDKSRCISSKVRDCVVLCGALELTFHCETNSSTNPDVFQGLVDLVALLDSVLEDFNQNMSDCSN